MAKTSDSKPSPSAPPKRTSPNRRGLVCAFILVAGSFAVYWPTTRYEFVAFDDSIYVSGNVHVQPGITWSGLKWALSATDGANWHPLTWVSHMLDCELFGPKPGGHHFTNIFLHSINSCLLFALMFRLTRRVGPSFVIAALFAWHPLHVESVAWVAERKDVLSTCFGLLSLITYQAYANTAKARISDTSGRVRVGTCYTASLLFFALSLASKPMLVTLPFVMLLLDGWPLGRISKFAQGLQGGRVELKRILLEKVPFLFLATLSCATTLWAQAQGGAIAGIRDLPIGLRITHAKLSYFRYLWKLLWPQNLAVFYPYMTLEFSWWGWLGAAVLILFCVLAIRLARFPYIAVGWLWFLGTLFPVIGLVQVGSQAMADRYTYFPSIGIFILVVFAADQFAKKSRVGAAIVAGSGGVALLALLIVTRQHVSYWHDSESLFRHAVDVTQGNFVACNNLGVALEARGDKEAAIPWYLEALRIKPDYPDAHCNLADCYVALKRSPEAVAEFETALRLNPRLTRAHYLLANQLLAQGDARAAEAHYKSALDIKPDYAEAHYQMAIVLLARGETADACDHFRIALRLKPNWIEALNNLAWVLATHPDARFRDGNQALELAARGVKLTHTNDARLLDTLGGALAELGRFSDATNAARTGARLANDLGATDLEREIEEHLQNYEKGQPFRETKSPTPISRK